MGIKLPSLVSLLLLPLWTLTANAQQWFQVSQDDRPITLNVSGIVISQAVHRFGPPPNRNWQTTIVQLAQEGQRIAKGDIVARFNNSSQDDRVRQLSGDLALRKGELGVMAEQQSREIEDEKISLAAAESLSKKSARKATQPADLIAGAEYQRLVEEKRIAAELWQRALQRQDLSQQIRTTRRQELEITIQQLEIQLASARQELEGFVIRAPMSGVAIIGTDQGGNKLDVNMSVHPGIVVVEVVDDSRLAVTAEIPEHTAALLRENQRALIVVDAAGGAELTGRVSEVANTVRRQSRGSMAMVRDITVLIDDNQPPVVKLGMSIQLSIETAVQADALAIPESSLVYRAGSPGVILRDGSWQAIVLGPRSGALFVVQGGLNSGQEIQL
jgi:hypothetical protein